MRHRPPPEHRRSGARRRSPTESRRVSSQAPGGSEARPEPAREGNAAGVKRNLATGRVSLAALGHEALRAEPEEEQGQQRVGHELSGLDPGRPPVRRQKTHKLAEQDWDEEHSDENPEIITESANDNGRDIDERLGISPARGGPCRDERNKHCPAKAT